MQILFFVNTKDDQPKNRTLKSDRLAKERLAKETQALIQNFLIYISNMIKDQFKLFFFFEKPENNPQ